MRQLYEKWHDHPYHPHIHWAIFVGLSLALSFSIINAINITYLGVPEVASAQTVGLVASYSFDEGAGTTAADSSGNNNTGTLVNGPTWATGKIGQAVGLDGVNDYISVPNLGSKISNAGGSIVAWIYHRTNGGYIYNAQSGNDPQFYIDSNGNGLTLSSRSGFGQAMSEYILLNRWYQVAGTWDGTGNCDMYINGVQSNDNSCSSFSIAPSGDVRFGTVLNGNLDEVRVYNRALSTDEITRLYNMGK